MALPVRMVIVFVHACKSAWTQVITSELIGSSNWFLCSFLMAFCTIPSSKPHRFTPSLIHKALSSLFSSERRVRSLLVRHLIPRRKWVTFPFLVKWKSTELNFKLESLLHLLPLISLAAFICVSISICRHAAPNQIPAASKDKLELPLKGHSSNFRIYLVMKTSIRSEDYKINLWKSVTPAWIGQMGWKHGHAMHM